MEKDLLLLIKKKCREKLIKREYCNELLRKLMITNIDKNYKKYKEIMAELEKLEYKKLVEETDEQIIYNTFYNYQHMIKKPVDIYVCLGTIMIDGNSETEQITNEVNLENHGKKTEFKIYKNIEDGISRLIPIHKCEEFDKNHTIIFPESTLADKYYNELQRKYIYLLITEGTKQAYQEIINRKENKTR